MEQLSINGGLVHIVDLTIDDSLLADLLLRQDSHQAQVDLVRRALAVGTRGVISMGVGLDLNEVDARVRGTLEQLTNEAEHRFERLLSQLTSQVETQMDPGRRGSLISQVMEDLVTWRRKLAELIDPEQAGSESARLLARLDRQLASALDTSGSAGGLALAFASIQQELKGLRDDLAEQRGRVSEAIRGTAKGEDYELVVDGLLRRFGKHAGALVEHTGRVAGSLGSDAVIGDHVVSLPSGARIVVESKNVQALDLTGAKGVLAELDRAMANREADAAICVSAQPAFPQEVGFFGVYGNRVLVVDDGEGSMLSVALRWVTTALAASTVAGRSLDPAVLAERIDRVRSVCKKFAAQRSALTEINKSVTKVSDALGEMRAELVSLVDQLASDVGGGPVLPMRRAG
jgi:hypothetical protein